MLLSAASGLSRVPHPRHVTRAALMLANGHRIKNVSSRFAHMAEWKYQCNPPSPHSHITQTHPHSHTLTAYCLHTANMSSSEKQLNGPAGLLPNVMGVRGYSYTCCMSNSLLALWVESNRKHIDEWCCSILRSAMALRLLLKCFGLFYCKTSTDRVHNDRPKYLNTT